MENYYDWTQDARRGSSDIDNLGNLCPCAGSNLGTRNLSGNASRSGCAEWRCANSCRQNGPGASWWGFRVKQCLCGSGQRHSLSPDSPQFISVNASCKLNLNERPMHGTNGFRSDHFAGPKTAGRDAALVITKLPKAEHDADEWRAGMQALLLVRRDRREAGAAKAVAERRRKLRFNRRENAADNAVSEAIARSQNMD